MRIFRWCPDRPGQREPEPDLGDKWESLDRNSDFKCSSAGRWGDGNIDQQQHSGRDSAGECNGGGGATTATFTVNTSTVTFHYHSLYFCDLQQPDTERQSDGGAFCDVASGKR